MGTKKPVECHSRRGQEEIRVYLESHVVEAYRLVIAVHPLGSPWVCVGDVGVMGESDIASGGENTDIVIEEC